MSDERPSSSPSPSPSPRLILAIIMGGLLVWAGYVAIGLVLDRVNPWRAAIVLVCMAAFVGAWLLLLWRRANRQPK